MLEVEFEADTEEAQRVMVYAKFEPISDYIETPYGEKFETYWHLISMKVKRKNCDCYDECLCCWPSDTDFEEYETEAKRLASKEAA